jgi:hypothetical protein
VNTCSDATTRYMSEATVAKASTSDRDDPLHARRAANVTMHDTHGHSDSVS